MVWNGKGIKPTIDVCYGCTKREVGCHIECKDYIDAKKLWEEEKQKINAERKKELEYDTFRFDSVSKRRVKNEKKARMRRKGK